MCQLLAKRMMMGSDHHADQITTQIRSPPSQITTKSEHHKDAQMLNQLLLAELARQTHVESLVAAERHHRLFRQPFSVPSVDRCAVVAFPAMHCQSQLDGRCVA